MACHEGNDLSVFKFPAGDCLSTVYSFREKSANLIAVPDSVSNEIMGVYLSVYPTHCCLKQIRMNSGFSSSARGECSLANLSGPLYS